MDAEEEDEDEEEELEGGDVSTQSEADANQSAASMTVDCGTEKMEEGNEDKENTSVISTSSDNLPTWLFLWLIGKSIHFQVCFWSFLKRGLLLKERICSLWEQILSF